MNNNKSQLLLVKLEVTEGLDPVPVKTADSVLCADVTPGYQFERIQRLALSQSISAVKELIGRETIDFTISCEAKGSGVAGTAPEIGALLQACGLTATVSAGISVGYAPTAPTGTWKTITIYLYKGGLLWKALACRGNVRFNAEAGAFGTFTFQMSGKFGGVSDAVVPSSPTYQSTIPVVVESGGFSFGAFSTAVIRSFGVDTGNQISPRPDINSVQGLKGYVIGMRGPNYTIKVEAELEATHSFWGDLRARTEEALDMVIGAVAGNIITFAAPKACSTSITVADDAGIQMYDIAGQLLENAGNDNYSFTFS
jgi:hypothetical protein